MILDWLSFLQSRVRIAPEEIAKKRGLPTHATAMMIPRNSQPAADHLPDIVDRADLIRLVDTFYFKVRADSSLGPIFDDVAKVAWETHLPKLYDFWDTVMFRSGTFRGDPIGAHLKLVPLTNMHWPMFERWLVLFRQAVAELFSGERAEHIVRCAEDMANVIHKRIHAITDADLDRSKLTSEQRERYASYRQDAKSSVKSP